MNIHSRHIFLFPFTWKNSQFSGSEGSKKQPDETFQAQLEAQHWTRSPIPISSSENDKDRAFNVHSYFHDFTRDALFDQGTNPESYPVLERFLYKIPIDSPQYQIWIKDQEQPDYSLTVEHVSLELYTTQVAVLSIHLVNTQYGDPEDIILINQFGRRLYPPFIPLDASKGLNGELAHKIAFNWGELEEDFGKYRKNFPSDRVLFFLPRHIHGLLPMTVKDCQYEAQKSSKDICIKPTIDDRMFVVCWVGNDEISNHYKEIADNPDWDRSEKLDHWWYRFIFVDGKSATVSNSSLFKEHLDDHSYLRWIGEGTMIGVTRHSLVMLTNGQWFGKEILATYLRDHYFHLAKLVLVQRASILKFSNDLTQFAGKAAKGEPATKQIKAWHAAYQFFLNRINFLEVTAQDQGIELYQLLRKVINLDHKEAGLNAEIAELKEYAKAYEEERQSEALSIFTVLGLVFTFYSFLNTFHEADYWKSHIEAMGAWYPVLLGGMFLVAVGFVIWRIQKTSLLRNIFRKQKFLYLLLLILIIIFSLSPMIF